MTNTRDIFFDTIQGLVKQGEDFVILNSDLAGPSLDSFRKNFLNRYMCVGVSEQNLISTASGLALTGKKVIAWGLNPFIVTRALDQILNTISIMNIPITFAGLHTGLSSAISGATHTPINDISIIRLCPHIKIINPSDITIAKLTANESAKKLYPIYTRFDKDINYKLYEDNEINFDDGINILNKGSKYVIISTGYHVNMLKQLLPELKQEGINPTLIDIYTFPFNEELLIKYIKDSEKIITIEEHSIYGGLGSIILEVLGDRQVNKCVKRIGIDVKDGFPHIFGRRKFFEKYFELDSNSLKENISGFFKER